MDYDRAIEELNIAIPMSPGSAEARAIRAFVLRRRGDIEEAIPDLLRSIELDPGNFSPHYVLADTYVILGDYERSISYYDRALELAPNNFGLKILRAYALTNIDVNSSAMRELIDDPAFSDGSSSVEILYRWEISLTRAGLRIGDECHWVSSSGIGHQADRILSGRFDARHYRVLFGPTKNCSRRTLNPH